MFEHRPRTSYPYESGPIRSRLIGDNPFADAILALSPTTFFRAHAVSGDEPNIGTVPADVGEYQSGSSRGTAGLVAMDADAAFTATITAGQDLRIAAGHGQPKGNDDRTFLGLFRSVASVNNQGMFGQGAGALRQAFGVIRSTTNAQVYAYCWSDDALLTLPGDIELNDGDAHLIAMRYDADGGATHGRFDVFVDEAGSVGYDLGGALNTPDSAIAVGGGLVTGNGLEGDADEFAIFAAAIPDSILRQITRAFTAAGHVG